MELIKKWKRKSLWSKIYDFIFIAFIVALLIPNSRIEIMAFVNRVKSMIIEPKVETSENALTVSASGYNWQLADINGNEVNLSEYKDKVLFVNIWATWCPPCVGEMPAIEGLYKKFKDNNKIKFLLISNEKKSVIKSFIERHKYSFPVYSSLSKTPKEFSSQSIPTTFLISKNGKIIIHKTGVSNWNGNKMLEIVNKLIEE